MPYYLEKKPEFPEEPKQEMKTTEKRRKLLRLSLAVVFCLLIGYGGIRLILYYSDLSASRETGRELRQIRDQADSETASFVPAEAETGSPSPAPAGQEPQSRETMLTDDGALPPGQDQRREETELTAGGTDEDLLRPIPYPDNPKLEISEQFRRLRKKSRYIIGWIRVDEMDEAVAQKDNTFFLNHDAMGKRNSNGAIFLDSDIRLLTRPYTFFLYGHNMKSGNMFGRLKKYKESAYFYRHRIISFDTMYEEGRYAVFSVMEMNTVPGTGLWYDLWALNSNSAGEREKAIRTLEKRSAVTSVLDVRADDQLLLLITCLDGETERLVVAARRLRNDETEDRLTLRPDQ